MKTENEQLGPPITNAELDKINGIEGKPEGLTPEQSQHWDDVTHDEHLLKTEGPMAKGFRLWGKDSTSCRKKPKRRNL